MNMENYTPQKSRAGRIKKIATLALLSLFLFSFAAKAVHAHCPLCSAAVGAAAVGASYLGVDPSIIGVFVGAFGLSTGIWVGRKIKKQYFKYQLQLITIVSFLLTVIPTLSYVKDPAYIPILLFGQSGTILNKVYWLNKLLLGSIIGAIATIFAFWLHNYTKKQRGKVLFPYQGVAFSLLSLFCVSAVLYFVMR